MSYIDSELKQYIERRAKESHVPPEKLGLAIDEAPEFDYLDPSVTLYEISSDFDGAEDVHVIVTGGGYEVNIADWMAEYYQALTVTNSEGGNPPSGWSVDVTPYVKDHETGEWYTHMSQGYNPDYRVTDQG